MIKLLITKLVRNPNYIKPPTSQWDNRSKDESNKMKTVSLLDVVVTERQFEAIRNKILEVL